MVAPDIFEDGPQITAFPVGPWREGIPDIAMAKLASSYPDYLTPAYRSTRSYCATRMGRGLSCSKCSPIGRRLSIRGSGW